MLSLFRHKKKIQPAASNADQDGMAKDVAAWRIRLQQRWAAFMQRQTERLSHNGKLVVLVLFCLVAGSFSIYLIADSLVKHSAVYIPVSRIKVRQYAPRSGDENTRSSVAITKQEYQRIKHFRHYMDSLARSPSGKRLYDSILKQRPGLMDSVAFVENIYQSQTK